MASTSSTLDAQQASTPSFTAASTASSGDISVEIRGSGDEVDAMLPAGRQPARVKRAWMHGLPLRAVRRTRVIALSAYEPMHDHVKNENGDTIRIELLPLWPWQQEHPLSSYGVSLAMRLYLHFLAEGALTFFVMFMLSVATINDSVQRASLRGCCREAASMPGGYEVLVRGANTSVHNENAAFTARCGGFAQLSGQCGYLGLPIRPFDPTSLAAKYASPQDPYLLWTALGTCEEYANTSIHGNEYVVPDLSHHQTPIIVPTPNAQFCFRPVTGVYWSVWMQFFCIVVRSSHRPNRQAQPHAALATRAPRLLLTRLA